MWPKNALDGSARVRSAAELGASSHGLHVRLWNSAGVRAHAAPRGSGRRVAIPAGEPKTLR